MDENWLLLRLLFLIPLLLSLSVHEWAHAWTAWRLGDPTAEMQGRLTLNPIAHIDPIGTLLLPLLGVPLGWAKPVPVNPARFRKDVKMGTGIFLTAAAGPLSNLCIALLFVFISAALLVWAPQVLANNSLVAHFLSVMIFLNVILAVFNMLPIPPLDGSRVVDGLVPDALRPAWDHYAQFGPLALVAVILLPVLFGINLVAWPLAMTQSLLRLLVDLLGG